MRTKGKTRGRRKRPIDRVDVSFVMHPAVRTRLKAEAALDGLTMTEKLHRLLCGAFNLHDLADRAPDYRDRSRSA